MNLKVEMLIKGAFPDADKARRNLARAVNYATKRERTRAARKIQQQIALSPGELRPSSGRLVVSRQASADDLEARIRAQFRPVSLARYARNLTSWKRGRPVAVTVRPGRTKMLRRAFPVKLPRGRVKTDTRYNLLLAIRLREGERPRNKKLFRKIGNGLWIMYAPSVQQAFISRNKTGVAKDTEAQTLADIEREWRRLMQL